MTEKQWVEAIAEQLRPLVVRGRSKIEVRTGLPLAYGYEIANYGELPAPRAITFQTDLAIVEQTADGRWQPRVVIEAKVGTVTTLERFL